MAESIREDWVCLRSRLEHEGSGCSSEDNIYDGVIKYVDGLEQQLQTALEEDEQLKGTIGNRS